jgi:lipoyl(octanoyl) transferase
MNSLQMTKPLFASLDIYHDIASRAAALNMAIDEALLEIATGPVIRFYKWDHPALSFGYFGKFADVANHAGQRDLVRRWTGGGIVFHGDDLTYSIVIPVSSGFFAQSAKRIYAAIHSALCHALKENGAAAALAPNNLSKISDVCFANPVLADVIVNGRKVAGAAQRRTRRGLLQQGSIQDVDHTNEFADQFASKLCSKCYHKTLDEPLIARAVEIAEQKYGAASWLQRR